MIKMTHLWFLVKLAYINSKEFVRIASDCHALYIFASTYRFDNLDTSKYKIAGSSRIKGNKIVKRRLKFLHTPDIYWISVEFDEY